jgi:4-hydroxy-tetrahydrodipicolinate synthase
MTEPAIRGVCPIIASPFTDDGAVDYDSLEHEIHEMAEQGCHAATLFGIASEFYKLSDPERDRMVEVVTDAAAEVDLPIVISVTHESTEVAVEWAEQYEAAGAACLMVFTPIFRDPPAEGIKSHLRQIGEAVDIPIMVQHTEMSSTIAPREFVDLHEEVPNIKYFKIEVDPPGPYISELVEAGGDDIHVLVGSAGRQMIEAYDRGAIGVMPAAMYNELYVAIHDALEGGERERAIELHTQLLGLLNTMQSIPSEKQLLVARGMIDTDYCREPVSTPADEVTEGLVEEYHERIMALIDDL